MSATARGGERDAAGGFALKTGGLHATAWPVSNKNVRLYENDNNDVGDVPAVAHGLSRSAMASLPSQHIRQRTRLNEHKCLTTIFDL